MGDHGQDDAGPISKTASLSDEIAGEIHALATVHGAKFTTINAITAAVAAYEDVRDANAVYMGQTARATVAGWTEDIEDALAAATATATATIPNA